MKSIEITGQQEKERWKLQEDCTESRDYENTQSIARAPYLKKMKVRIRRFESCRSYITSIGGIGKYVYIVWGSNIL